MFYGISENRHKDIYGFSFRENVRPLKSWLVEVAIREVNNFLSNFCFQNQGVVVIRNKKNHYFASYILIYFA